MDVTKTLNYINENPPIERYFKPLVPSKNPPATPHDYYFFYQLLLLFNDSKQEIDCYRLRENEEDLLYLFSNNRNMYVVSMEKYKNKILGYTTAKNFFADSGIDIEPEQFEIHTPDVKIFFADSVIESNPKNNSIEFLEPDDDCSRKFFH